MAKTTIESEVNTWPLIKQLFKEKGLARQHLDSYDTFLETGLQDILDDFSNFTVNTPDSVYKMEFGKINVDPPRAVEHDGTPIQRILPSMARLRNFTYAAPMHLQVKTYKDDEYINSSDIYIGDMPVMLKSKLCYLSTLSKDDLIEAGEDKDDPGGYFIINGSERAIISLEDLATNSIITEIDRRGTVPKFVAKVLSVKGILRTQVTASSKKGIISILIPWVNTAIPFIVIMRALGFESDEEIANAISNDPTLLESIAGTFEQGLEITDNKSAVTYIGNRAAFGVSQEFRDVRVQYILDKYLFPHIGVTKEYRKKKGYFLADMIRRVAELSVGLRSPDDRDHYGNKRLRLAGPLLAQIFARAFKKLLKDLKYQLERRYVTKMNMAIESAVRPSYVTSRLYKALATGTWSIRTTGVTQLLDRTNFVSTQSHLRRLQSPLTRTRPQFEARELHASHLGRICPVESPEGQNIGLVKNLALSALVSKERAIDMVLEILYNVGLIDVEKAKDDVWSSATTTKIFLNGIFVGFTLGPDDFVFELRKLRKQLILPEDIGIYYKSPVYDGTYGEIYVDCDAGRILRPLIIVENGKSKLEKEHINGISRGLVGFNSLLKLGVIELIDASEEFNISTAFNVEDITPSHTHLELSPDIMFGVSGAIIPYTEHNQSPRNSYEAAMIKQALGIPYTNFSLRADSRAHLSVYPQKPLVQTRLTETLGINDRPIGQNFIVAVLSGESYNMEDAIIINKSSIQRGLAHSLFYQTYKTEARRYVGGTKDIFEIPGADIRDYAGENAYRHLQDDGLISPETEVKRGDVIIGKTSPPRFQDEFKKGGLAVAERRDSSLHLTQHKGIVDTVFMTTGPEGERIIHVRVREHRTPELGDKFASRHGQKGVIGLLMNIEDMPYTVDGVVPDLIINPHAFPSRMTAGQFLESIAAKISCLSGKIMDGSPFTSPDHDDLKQMLSKYGFDSTGLETLHDGKTGKPLKAQCFIGGVYYQKLHHMVADKIHARAYGPVQMLTRQPTEGRSRGGGLRIGEMEKDTFVAYGASAVIQERLLESSDKTEIYICSKCGLEGFFQPSTKKIFCPRDKEGSVLASVEVSYAFRLLLDELKSLNIYPKVVLGEGV